MCGICGLWSSAADGHSAIVAAMNAALRHRGPDDSGQYHDDACAIGMRRLSIIDLAGGHQPISNEDDSLHIVFNGEIYNYVELREDLEKSGRHQFKTHSDTEVILHLYEEHKEDTPKLLKGMFAFCIYDSTTQSLFVARDRFGEKPLYYTVVNGAFAFSSELPSLLEWSAVERRIDINALFYYLNVGFVPSPLTMFANVCQLPAGHWLRWNNGDLQVGAYYSPVYKVDSDLCDEEVAKAAVRTCILKAVKRQTISDVPVGAFLSGGIDSSTVVAAMQQQSSKPVKTFNVRFEHAPYDESPIAREVARHLGTDHHEFVVSNNAFDSESFWQIVERVGFPFSDSSAIPTFLISKQIRDHVKVCLSGDGGDEMFAGYDYFRWSLSLDRLADTFSAPLLRMADGVLQNVARWPAISRLGSVRKARRATEIAKQPAIERALALGTIFEVSDIEELAADSIKAQWRSLDPILLRDMLNSGGASTRLRQLMSYRVQFSLAEDMLVKVDRMSMANSLEVRAPMLDAELADLSMRLPDDLLIKNGITKYILRQAVRDWLPDSVFSHPKMGFSIPLHKYQNDEYRKLCYELILSDQNGPLQQLFSRDALQRVVERGLNRERDAADFSVYRASHQLWALLQLAAWMHNFRVRL